MYMRPRFPSIEHGLWMYETRQFFRQEKFHESQTLTPLGIIESQLWAPLKVLEHHGNVVSGGLRWRGAWIKRRKPLQGCGGNLQAGYGRESEESLLLVA